MMRNEEIAHIFDDVADMLEIGGENFFRVRAYRNAARAVRDFPMQVAELPADRLTDIPGFGADLSAKLATVLDTGDLPFRIELMRNFPRGLLELKNLPALGPKRILAILQAMHELYQEPRYRPSPWLRRRAELGASLLTPEH